MIIIFIFIGLTILGIGMWEIYEHTNHKIFGSDKFGILGQVIVLIGGLVAVVLITCAIIENSLYNAYKVKWNERYTNLYTRYEANASNDDMLWSDITKFNCDLKNAQYWHENILTNWLNEGACMEFNFIPAQKTEDVVTTNFIGPVIPPDFKEQ